MSRTLFVLVLVAAVVGATVYAQVRPTTFVGGGFLQMGSVRVTADHMTVKYPGASVATANASTATRPDALIESGLFQGHVTINQGDSVVKADEAKYNPDTHELELSGNVRVAIPATAPSVK